MYRIRYKPGHGYYIQESYKFLFFTLWHTLVEEISCGRTRVIYEQYPHRLIKLAKERKRIDDSKKAYCDARDRLRDKEAVLNGTVAEGELDELETMPQVGDHKKRLAMVREDVERETKALSEKCSKQDH